MLLGGTADEEGLAADGSKGNFSVASEFSAFCGLLSRTGSLFLRRMLVPFQKVGATWWVTSSSSSTGVRVCECVCVRLSSAEESRKETQRGQKSSEQKDERRSDRDS